MNVRLDGMQTQIDALAAEFIKHRDAGASDAASKECDAASDGVDMRHLDCRLECDMDAAPDSGRCDRILCGVMAFMGDLMSGDTAAAKARYQKVLSYDAANLKALLAQAALADQFLTTLRGLVTNGELEYNDRTK